MPEYMVALAGFVSLIATVLSIINVWGIIQQRKRAPSEEREKQLEAWRAKTDTHLDADNKRINKLEERSDESESFQRLTLQSLKGIIAHLMDGNHTDAMKQLSNKIDEFLIER